MIRVLVISTAILVACVALFRLPAQAQQLSLKTSTPTPEASPKPIRLGSVNIPNDGKWHFTVTPYVWAPQINGTFQIPVPPPPGTSHKAVTISPHVSPSAYIPHINALGMITGEARKNSDVVSFDYIWMNISTQKSGAVDGINTNEGLRVTANIWTVAAGRTIANSDSATLDALIGVRQLDLHSALNWNFSAPISVIPQSGTVAKSGTVTDIVGELRGKIRIGTRFSVPYYFDGGFGHQSSTMQAATGLTYNEKWGEVNLIYRALIYNANPASLNQRLTFNGLAIGVTYRL